MNQLKKKNKPALEPLIKIHNYGRGTRLSILGIDISRAVFDLKYDARDDDNLNKNSKLGGNIKVEIDLNLLTGVLSKLSNKELENAGKILSQYCNQGQ